MKITLISRIVLFIALFIMQSGLGLASQCESGFRNSTMSLEWTPEVCRYVIEKTNLLPGPACNYTLHSQETISNILVTGTARSGTTMISVLLKSLGYPFSDDNHAPTKNGMMSWMLIVKGSPQHFHDSGRSYRFRNMIHLVRDPLQCIVSLRTEIMYWKKSGFLLQYAPEVKVKELDEQSETDLLLFGLRVWVNWHALVDRAGVGTLVQVEKFCKRHNLATLLHYMCENKAHSAAALDLLHDQCRAKCVPFRHSFVISIIHVYMARV